MLWLDRHKQKLQSVAFSPLNSILRTTFKNVYCISFQKIFYTVVPVYLHGTRSKTPKGYLKLPIVPNPTYNCIFACAHASFHLQEALIGFSLAHLSCQHHYSCALGPLLSKIGVTWTRALWYHHSRPDNKDGCFSDGQGTYCEWIYWTKGWFTSQEGQSGMFRDSIMLFKVTHNLKLMNFLSPEFSI